MSSFYVRAALDFELSEESKWFADKALMGKLVDAVLDSELGGIFTYAGREYEEKPAKDKAAVKKAMITGKEGTTSALDAPETDGAPSHFSLRTDSTSLAMAVRIGGATLERHAATALATLERICEAYIALMRPRGGVSEGMIYVADDDGDLVYPRPRPPVHVGWGTMTQIVQYVDVRYHNDEDYGGTRPEIVNAVAKAKVPAGIERTERDQLITLRYVTSLADRAEVMQALGRRERWLATVLPAKPAPGFNELGDREDAPYDRSKKAPFTFWNKDENVGYKAIMVGPEGEVDDDVWDELVALQKGGKSGKAPRIRLIVPLRDQAIALQARAKSAGFDAVLYPDDRKRFWNPDPPGDWVEPIKPTPGPTPGRESAKSGNRNKR